MSHEFRTPLTLILSPLEDLLGSGDRVPREMIDMLTLVHRNAVRLLYMVNNLLEFTTSEAKYVASILYNFQSQAQLCTQGADRVV